MRPVRGVGWRPTEYTLPLGRADFDPGKHPRDPGGPGGGQFVKVLSGLGGGGAPTPPGALANKRVTMADVPLDSPVREHLNTRLATPQVMTRGPHKGEVVRPAAPPYHRSVQQVRDAILDTIAAQHTLGQGKTWYPTERVHAEARAKAYGVSVEQAAGVMSATSPRCSYAINQRVTDEILDAAPRLHEAAHPLAEAGGGVMGTFRDDGVRIALGESIDGNLTGTKRRSFFNNIVWPGQTQDVTVDTWMYDAVAQGLGMTHEQAAHLGVEKTKDFPDTIGYMLASDATRDAARRLGVSPDAAQAAYWIGRQQGLGLENPTGQQGRTKRGSTGRLRQKEQQRKRART